MMLCCDKLFFNSSDWCISIPAVLLSDLLPRWSAVARLLVVVFFDRGHSRFWNFYSTIPFDVVRVKSYINCFFDSARDPYHYTRETNEKNLAFIVIHHGE